MLKIYILTLCKFVNFSTIYKKNFFNIPKKKKRIFMIIVRMIKTNDCKNMSIYSQRINKVIPHIQYFI